MSHWVGGGGSESFTNREFHLLARDFFRPE